LIDLRFFLSFQYFPLFFVVLYRGMLPRNTNSSVSIIGFF